MEMGDIEGEGALPMNRAQISIRTLTYEHRQYLLRAICWDGAQMPGPCSSSISGRATWVAACSTGQVGYAVAA